MVDIQDAIADDRPIVHEITYDNSGEWTLVRFHDDSPAAAAGTPWGVLWREWGSVWPIGTEELARQALPAFIRRPHDHLFGDAGEIGSSEYDEVD